MKYLKTFENINKNYNGIIYYYNNNGDDKYVQFWVFINDISDYYEECIEINSIGAIKDDSMTIGDLLSDFNVSVQYSDIFFITSHRVNEFEKTMTYGACYECFDDAIENDIFLKKLSKISMPKYVKPGELKIVDVKKVRINKDGTHHVYSDEEIELEESTKKYNI